MEVRYELASRKVTIGGEWLEQEGIEYGGKGRGGRGGRSSRGSIEHRVLDILIDPPHE